MASMAMKASAMPGGATPPSPLPSPARPLTSPCTLSQTANTAPPKIPLHQSTPPVGSGIQSMPRTTEQGGQADSDLQAGLVRVKLQAAAGDVPKSGPSSKKKGKKGKLQAWGMQECQSPKAPSPSTYFPSKVSLYKSCMILQVCYGCCMVCVTIHNDEIIYNLLFGVLYSRLIEWRASELLLLVIMCRGAHELRGRGAGERFMEEHHQRRLAEWRSSGLESSKV